MSTNINIKNKELPVSEKMEITENMEAQPCVKYTKVAK